jgi:hypothetical protein
MYPAGTILTILSMIEHVGGVHMSRRAPRDLIVSYLNQRRIVGAIGILLPFVLRIGIIFFNHKAPYSISSYYYSPMRNVLVAALCVLGLFLIAYKGYDDLDSGITNVAGVAAIGVAFFPTSDPSFSPAWVGRVHPFFAAVAIASLALMALQFTQTEPGNEQGEVGKPGPKWTQDIKRIGLALLFRYQNPQCRTDKKKVRDRIYSSCAWLILVGLVLGFAQNFWPKSAKDVTQWLFWFEALAVIAFGVSWLVKGETILKDSSGSRRLLEHDEADQAAVQ